MTYQVVRLAYQFLIGKTTDRDKGIVAVGNAAIQVGGGDKPLFIGKGSFMLSYGQIHAHLGVPCLEENDRKSSSKGRFSRAFTGVMAKKPRNFPIFEKYFPDIPFRPA